MSKDPQPGNAEEKKDVTIPDKATCGLVMPISACDGCGSDHWSEVKEIILDAIGSIQKPKFTVDLVSNEDPIGVIHKRIIQNLYSSDVVVCDVSGKNSNVMFELGLRLAFDKPTVIINDDKTPRSFDTAVIEHLEYPRDLRFSRIVKFKAELSRRVDATFRHSKEDPKHSTFLGSFGQFKVAKIDEKHVGVESLLLTSMEELRADVRRLQSVTADSERRTGLDKVFYSEQLSAERFSAERISTLRLSEAILSKQQSLWIGEEGMIPLSTLLNSDQGKRWQIGVHATPKEIFTLQHCAEKYNPMVCFSKGQFVGLTIH